MSTLLNRGGSTLRKSTPGVQEHKHYSPDKGRPTDILIGRLDQYKTITKGLIAYFEAVVKSEQHLAKELTKEATDLPLPLVQGNQFIQEDGKGWQSALYGLRDHSRAIAGHHNELAAAIESGVLADLKKVKAEIKQRTEEVLEVGKTADETDVLRDNSTKALGEHGRSVGLVGSTPIGKVTAKDDPFLTHTVVQRQLHKQLDSENALTKGIIHSQQQVEALEARITKLIQSAYQSYASAQKSSNDKVQQEWVTIGTSISNLDPTAEYEFYRSKGHVVDPDTKLRDPSLISFPNQDHEATRPLKEGILERKTRFKKNYIEFYFVLTPAGFLHEYPAAGTGSKLEAAQPVFSLFLPGCHLGPPAQADAGKHKFYLEGKKTAKKGLEGKMKSLGIGNKETAYTFKARSHAEMQDWWNAFDRLCKSSATIDPTPSEAGKQVGEVPALVSSVGLPEGQVAASAEEEEEEAGSSADEEEFSAAAESPGASTSAATTSAAHPAAASAPLSKADEAAGDALPSYIADSQKSAPVEKTATPAGEASTHTPSAVPAPAAVA